jgi:glycosyltransferase involved in cell wall biosynthesis
VQRRVTTSNPPEQSSANSPTRPRADSDHTAVARRSTVVPSDARTSGAGSGHSLRLTVVICAYTEERWSDLESAVGSIREQTHRVHQIVLVADHNPALLERARRTFIDVECLPNTGLRGLAAARNTGVVHATGDIVAFLDDDALAAPSWAESLLGAYADPSVIGVGGTVYPMWRHAAPRWFPEQFLWVVGCSYVGLPTGSAEIRNPIGANMSFRRSVFAGAGGFNPTMGRNGQDGAGCEETEFSIRARRTHPGGRILLEPGAVCFHRVSKERSSRRYFRRRCRAEGRSKAVVARLAGPEAALEAERAYLTRVLPRGVVWELEYVLRGEYAGVCRAWMLVEGAVLTAAGYAVTRVRQRLVPNHSSEQPVPRLPTSAL